MMPTFCWQYNITEIDNQKLRNPSSIAIINCSKEKRIYIADPQNNRILLYSISNARHGKFAPIFGGKFEPGDVKFHCPSAVAMALDNRSGLEIMFVVEYRANRVQAIRVSDGAFIRKWGSRGSDDGQFKTPYGAIIGGENIFITDSMNYRILLTAYSILMEISFINGEVKAMAMENSTTLLVLLIMTLVLQY